MHAVLSDAAKAKSEAFHRDVVEQVVGLVAEHKVVVVGMGWNPHVRRARKALDGAGVAHHYLEIGNYAVKWKERLAVKMFSGWPTFPQVFVDGVLIGGANETEAAVADGLFS